MGVIQRQSIKRIIVQYTGVVIGFLATIFVYSRYTNFYGLSQYVIDTATLLSYFILLGINTLPIRFFPYYNQSKQSRNAFLTFLLTCTAISILVSSVVLFFIYDLLKPYLINDSDPLFSKFLMLSFPFAIIIGLKRFFTAQINNYKRIVVPAILDGFLLKIGLPSVILITVFLSWDYTRYLYVLLFLQLVALSGLIIYLNFLDKIQIRSFRSTINKQRFREMMVFAFYGLFGALGSFLALRIDTIFIARYVDTNATGVYKIMGYFTTLLNIPYSAIIGISAPIIAQYLKNGKVSEVKKIYKNSSMTLLLFGTFIFLCILLNTRDIFEVLPFQTGTDVSSAFFVILFIGMARIFDLATSVNTQIILYSKYYRFNFYTLIILGGLNFGLDYFLVPKHGLYGAALATMSSLALYNLIKIVYVKFRFGIWPFKLETFNIACIGFITFVIVYLLPVPLDPILNILFKCLVISILYGLPMYFLGYLDPLIRGGKETIWRFLGRS